MSQEGPLGKLSWTFKGEAEREAQASVGNQIADCSSYLTIKGSPNDPALEKKFIKMAIP